MIKLITERRVKVVILILAKAKASFGAPASSVQSIQVELLEVGSTIGEDRKVRSQ